MKVKYEWKRFWAPPDSQISLSDGGFLHDPTDEAIGKYINPNLVQINPNEKKNCLILLGEPGIGKSVEIENLYQSVKGSVGKDETVWMDLREYMSPDEFLKELEGSVGYQQWVKNGKPLYLFLDSFDEGVFSFPNFTRSFGRLLSRNSDKINTLFVRISSRTAVWPSFLEDTLEGFWASDMIGKYELCPLTKSDVISALKVRGIDADKFLDEVNKKGVTALAGKPLTLKMLIELFEKNKSLPEKKSEIYEQGCDLLVQEPDPSKKIGNGKRSKLSLIHRRVIAERIAIATLVGGKPVIALDDSKAAEGDLKISELVGKEIIGNAEFEVDEEKILEVLDSGLFSARGDGRMGWAHQTYGEYLTARYLERHKLSWTQVRSFLFQDPLKIGSFQVVPQLYEVCAWFASLDNSFFDNAVLLDPEFLMLSDANVITNSQREALTEQLLIRFAKGELLDRWEIFNFTNYKKLCHPKIADQLLPYISDSSIGVVARRTAIDIAASCFATALEKPLLGIALNEKEKLAIRVRAVRAIAEGGSESAKKILKPLASSGFGSDPEDELRGVTLDALWPGHLSAKELFSLLTPPKKRNFMGAYYGFTERKLGSSMKPGDIAEGLVWVEKNAESSRSTEYFIGRLADDILIHAWKHPASSKEFKEFAKIAYSRLKDFEEIVGNHAIDEKITAEFQALIEADDGKRHSFLENLVSLSLNDPERKNGRNGFILLPHRKNRIIFSRDLPWLLQWLSVEKSGEAQKLLSEVASRIFDIHDTRDINLIFAARTKNTYLKNDTSYWFDPIMLGSEEAKSLKKQWEQEKEWSKKRERDEKEEILKVISPEKIETFLRKSEGGDTDAWWRLNNAMCMYQHEITEEDIRKLPGWKVIDESTQKRIIEAGKEFILQQASKPEIWLGKKVTYYPAFAGYRALNIFLELEKDFIDGLDEKTWKGWAPITVAMPLITNDPKNGELISLAYKKAPDEIIQTLEVVMEDEIQRHGSLFITSLLDGCVDERMVKFLLDKVKTNGFNPRASYDILRFLLKHKVQTAKDYIKATIKIPLSKVPAEKEQGLFAAVALLWSADGDDWEYLWKLIKQDKEFGQALIERSHEHPLEGSNILRNLNELQLADLYMWMMKNFPPEKYFQPEGGYTVTPQISIGEWRDSVIRSLMEKGTPEACRQIDRVASALPNYKWIKEYTLLQARRIALQKSWQPPKIESIFTVVENHELRLVNTPDELMDIILDSLARYETKLQKQSQPQAIYLWNENKVSETKNGKKETVTYYSPKDEGRLSDNIADYLRQDLRDRGIVVDREVEIERGSKTDIHISVFSRDKRGRPTDINKVTIEVKGSWNDEIGTAMEAQLVKRYLSGADCSRGIYLIGWFQCDKWNDPSAREITRRKKAQKTSIQDARGKYSKQAVALSSKNAVRVEAVVLDTRI